MRFQPDTFMGTNAITRHDGAVVWVNGERQEGALLVPWKGAVQAWPAPDWDGVTVFAEK